MKFYFFLLDNSKVTSSLNSGNGLHIIQIDEIEPEFPLLEPLPSITFYVAAPAETPSTSKHISTGEKDTSSKINYSDYNSATSYTKVILLLHSVIGKTLEVIFKDLSFFRKDSSDIVIENLFVSLESNREKYI